MLNYKIEDIKFVIFDVETTGLSFNQGDRVIEIAALKLQNNRVVDKFNSLINCGRQVAKEAFLVNRISNAMLIDAPKPEEVMPRFLDFIKETCICAYNANFDMGFLINELKLLGINFDIGIPILDILVMARKLLPDLERYPLWNVAENLKIKQRQVHRAMEDVEIEVKIFRRLIEMSYEKNIYQLCHLKDLFGVKIS